MCSGGQSATALPETGRSAPVGGPAEGIAGAAAAHLSRADARTAQAQEAAEDVGLEQPVETGGDAGGGLVAERQLTPGVTFRRAGGYNVDADVGQACGSSAAT